MENKTIKIVDEHGIDRTANVVCGFKVDGTEYVLYWIERDGDNDNLFVSRVFKNNDGTFNMVNIEDSMEKNKIAELVKKLVTFAINADASVVEGTEVTLADGTKVDIFPTLFNKEQNINVPKTYITTVKKSVTKVSEDFYKVKKEETFSSDNSQIFVDIPSSEVAMPEIDNAITNSVEEQNPVSGPEPDLSQISVIPPVLQTPEVNLEPAPEPVPPLTTEAVPPIPEVLPSQPVSPIPDVVIPPVDSEPVKEVPVEPQPFFTAEASATMPIPVAEPEPAPQLVFDGSKETNLGGTLGEANVGTQIPVQDVSAIREFGQSDIPVPSESTEPVTPNSGFASNKYILIVAFIFFMASCAFLGYEVYRYLQVK